MNTHEKNIQHSMILYIRPDSMHNRFGLNSHIDSSHYNLGQHRESLKEVDSILLFPLTHIHVHIVNNIHTFYFDISGSRSWQLTSPACIRRGLGLLKRAIGTKLI